MANESKLLGLVFITVILVISYGYVTGEVQTLSDADPTHTGKAFMASSMPYFWMMLIMLSLGVTVNETWEEIS